MTDNMDEFEDQFDSPEEQDGERRTVKQSLLEAWRNKPLFKLFAIMLFVGFALAGALGAFSGTPPIEAAQIGQAPSINQPPGGPSSDFFIDQNKQANEQRVNEALEQGKSAIPTPHGPNVDLSELTDKNRKDPLLEFRAETERMRQEMRAEQKQAAQQIQVLQQQIVQKPQEEDDSLARAMQKQMEELMEGWKPRKLIAVNGIAPPKEEPSQSALLQMQQTQNQANALGSASSLREKVLVPAGTVSYAQLLTEANSDVPGPILLQILSGPLSGARAIGQFQVMNDYLVLTFNLVSFKGKEYSISALALNPDTTLGGLATEVDHRYFSRVLLPAAASFMSAFGSALSEGSSEVVTTGDTVVVTQAKKGVEDATYAGLGQVGESLSEFFRSEANQIKPLVRVAVGTPMGLFFLQSVKENQDGNERFLSPMQQDSANMQELLARGYQQSSSRRLSDVEYDSSSRSSYTGANSGGSSYTTKSGASSYGTSSPINLGRTTIYSPR